MARRASKPQRSAEQIVDLVDFDKVTQAIIAESTAMEGDLRDNGPVGRLLEGMQSVAIEALKGLIDVNPDDKTTIIDFQNKIQLYRETANQAEEIIRQAESVQAEDFANQNYEE